MTSANVIEYRIEKNGEEIGNFRKHLMCRLPDYSDLLKYKPTSDYTITPYGYDEEEDYWEEETENLKDFLQGLKSNKIIDKYFKENEL
jgi:hypothetical protein